MTAFVAAIVITLVCAPAVVVIARRWHLIDVPNRRSSHAMPTPRGGGLAVMAGVFGGVFTTGAWDADVAALAIAGVALGAVGLVDDRFGLPTVPRLVAQVVVPALTVAVVINADESTRLMLVPLLVLVVAGYVNAFNFMDGINGISAWQTVVAGTFLALLADDIGGDPLAACGWAVAGAALGFLPYNAIRAKLFLGDVGSYFIGTWLAGLAVLLVDAGAPLLVAAAPFLLYVADTTTVLVRRALRRERLTEAHREHAYQRLTQLGYPHATIAVVCGAISAACAGMMWVVRDSSLAAQAAVFALCLLLVGGYLASPGWLGRRTDPALVRS